MSRAPLLLLLAAACLVSLAGASANAAGRKMVGVYELSKGDFSVKVTNWGATVTSVVFPDSRGISRAPSVDGDSCLSWDFRFGFMVSALLPFCPLLWNADRVFFPLSGNLGDVVLGYDTIAEYVVSSLTPLFS
jgi:aldose 1-epimerase